jgi:uncharacterized membrane protein YkoI
MTATCQRDDRIPWRLLLLIPAVAVPAFCCAPGAAVAAETGKSLAAAQGVNAPGIISKEQATQAALQALPGKVTDVTVEKKRGKNVYVIEIVGDKDGAETDVLIDMASGAVLGMDH